jgi:hypothetical protein
VLNTCIRRPADAELAAEFYRRALHDTQARHAQFAASLYQSAYLHYPQHAFWRVRANLSFPITHTDEYTARMEANFIVRR